MSYAWQWQAAKVCEMKLMGSCYGMPLWHPNKGNWHDYNLIRQAYEKYGAQTQDK